MKHKAEIVEIKQLSDGEIAYLARCCADPANGLPYPLAIAATSESRASPTPYVRATVGI